MRKYVILSLSAIGSFLLFELACLAFSNIQAAAAKSNDLNNLKQIGIAFNNYNDALGKLPLASIPLEYETVEKRLSWAVSLTPFLECGSPYSEFNRNEPWDSEHNLPHVQSPYRPFRCPSLSTRSPATACAGAPFSGRRVVKKSEEMAPPWSSSYVAISGIGPQSPFLPLDDRDCGALGHERQVPIQEITDGASNTILVMETGQQQGSWAAAHLPTLRWIDVETTPQVGEGGPFGRIHGDWFWAAKGSRTFAAAVLADGSGKVFTSSISSATLKALVTIAGDDRPGSDW